MPLRPDRVRLWSNATYPADDVYLANGAHGVGVYARRNIDRGTQIEVCPVLLVPDDKYLYATPLQYYCYAVPEQPKAYAIALGYGSLYNHSPKPNLRYFWYDGMLYFVAVRNIRGGEELTIDYGYQP